MKTRLVLLTVLVLGWSTMQAYAQEASEDLTADGRKVVDYLMKEWKQRYRSTSISMAMDNIGIEKNDNMRLQVGQYFRNHTDLANNLKWFGANNYILSDDEKLIAKYMINTENRLPDLQALSSAVGVSIEDLKDRLSFMAKAGLLQKSEEGKLGYSLAEGYKSWGAPLQHNFHTVSIPNEKSFGVW